MPVLRAAPLCLALAYGAAGVAGCGGGTTDVATFTRPEPARWTVSSHPLGRGAFRPANVGFGPAGLTLRMPEGTLDGGELQARRARGSGTSTARMRTSSSPGSISAFFLYRQDLATDSSDELDFEIPGGPPYRAILTVWRKGQHVPTAQRTVSLAFDPAAALHDYRFVRDGTKVTFVVDGRTRFAYAHAPSVALPPVFNAWYPTWQDPTQPPAGGVMRVARYTFAS